MFLSFKQQVVKILMKTLVGRFFIKHYYLIRKHLRLEVLEVISVREYAKRYGKHYYCFERKHNEEVIVYSEYGKPRKSCSIPFQELYGAELENAYIVGNSDMMFADKYMLTDRVDDISDDTWVIPCNTAPQVLKYDIRTGGGFAIVNMAEYDVIEKGISLCYRFSPSWYHSVAENMIRMYYIDTLKEYREWPLLIDEEIFVDNAKREFLSCLNVGNRPLHVIKSGQMVKVGQLLHVSPEIVEVVGNYADKLVDNTMFHMYNVHRKKAVQYVHDCVCQNKKYINNRKVFVPRMSCDRVINQEQVASFLSSRGFEICPMEGLSFEDEVKTFAEAKVIITIFGSTYTNMMFASPGTKIFMISLEKHCGTVAECYSIADAVGAEFYNINGEMEEEDLLDWTQYPSKQYYIDIEKLANLVDLLESED